MYSSTRGALALEVVRRSRARKPRVREPVRRPGQRRLEAARDLVLALRAGLEALRGRARCSTRCPGSSRSRSAGCGSRRPRPSSGRTACRRPRRRSRPPPARAVALGELDQHRARQRARDCGEERRVQVVARGRGAGRCARRSRRSLPRVARRSISPPRRLRNVMPASATRRRSRLRLLALVGAEAVEEVVEVAVAVVAPVELAVVARAGSPRPRARAGRRRS